MPKLEDLENDLYKLGEEGTLSPETVAQVKQEVQAKRSLSEPTNVTAKVKASQGEPLLNRVGKTIYQGLTENKKDEGSSYIEPDVAYSSVEVNNPKTGKNEVFENVSKSQFNQFMKDGYSLVDYNKAQTSNMPITASEQPLVESTIPQSPDVNLDVSAQLEPQAQQPIAPLEGTQSSSESVKVKGPLANVAPVKNVMGGKDAFTMQQDAEKALADAQIVENAKKTELYDKKALLETEKAQEKAKLAQELAEKSEAKLKAIDADVEKYQSAAIKDPNMWADKSTASKILAGIGLFLGAAPNSSGQNMAVSVIEKSLDRNLQVQKANLDKMEKGIGFKRNALTDLYATYKDKDLAIDAFNSIQLGVVDSQLKKMADISSNEKVKANLQKAQGLIQEQKQELDLKRQAQITNQYNAETQRMGVMIDAKKAEQGKQGLLPGQEALDKKFGEEYATYKSLGGYTNIAGDIKALEGIVKELKDPNGPNLTGAGFRFVPDKITPNKPLDRASQVKAIIQKSIKAVLPGAISDYEGKEFQKNAYDPGLSEEYNAARLEVTLQKIKQAAAEKERAGKYFEQTGGTLRGYEGPTINQYMEEQKTATLSPEEKSNLAWANSNPKNPKAQMFKQVLNRKYGQQF